LISDPKLDQIGEKFSASNIICLLDSQPLQWYIYFDTHLCAINVNLKHSPHASAAPWLGSGSPFSSMRASEFLSVALRRAQSSAVKDQFNLKKVKMA